MKKILIILFILIIYEKASADKLTGKLYIGWGFTLKNVEYADNPFLKDNLINNGGNAGISLYYDGLSYNRRNRIGIFVDYLMLGISQKTDFSAILNSWLITPYYEHIFAFPGKKKFIPSIILGISMVYFDIRLRFHSNIYPETEFLLKHKRYFDIGLMAGLGFSYYFSDTFSLDLMIRIIYVPFDNNVVNIFSSFGFSTTF